jgi:hypothetical protein
VGDTASARARRIASVTTGGAVSSTVVAVKLDTAPPPLRASMVTVLSPSPSLRTHGRTLTVLPAGGLGGAAHSP